eukprot:2463910-Pyramimonas_sp.AAC.1
MLPPPDPSAPPCGTAKLSQPVPGPTEQHAQRPRAEERVCLLAATTVCGVSYRSGMSSYRRILDETSKVVNT